MNSENLRIGACEVEFGGENLGHTLGGVTINYSPEDRDILADYYGTSVIDKVRVGENFTITVPIAEIEASKLKNVFASGTVEGATDKRITFGRKAGFKLSDVAKQLVIRPLYDPDGDGAFVFHKAVAFDEFEISYNNDEQTVAEVTFMVLIDETKDDGNFLGFYGDSLD